MMMLIKIISCIRYIKIWKEMPKIKVMPKVQIFIFKESFYKGKK